MIIEQPYAILSDHHCHDWNQFAEIHPNGINSRLQIILDEMKRAALILKKAGGTYMIFAGDLFHVRGKIQPSVFNPTYRAIAEICALGIKILAIPGNHDLEGKETSEIGNAMQSLGQIEGFHVVTEPTRFGEVIMIPWVNDVSDLMKIINDVSMDDYIEHGTRENLHIVVHAPLNGVIKGIPDVGLDVQEIDDMGFGLFFAGHFHDHKSVSKNATVWSIGATTHQTWNDPNSKAGFIIVNSDNVEHHESHAPKFLNYDEVTDEHQFKGNYVRIREKELTVDEAQSLRKHLEIIGAIGIVDHSSKKVEASRVGITVKTGASMEQSIADFIETSPLLKNKSDAVKKLALQILDEARNEEGE